MVIMGFTLFRVPRRYCVSKRAFARLQSLSILIVWGIFLAVSRRVSGYALEGQHWPAGTLVTFQMGLGSAGRTLIDGNTSWDTAAAPALTAWDHVMARLQYTGNVASPPVSSGDGVNAIVFSNTVFGQKFGTGTLAAFYWPFWQYFDASGRRHWKHCDDRRFYRFWLAIKDSNSPCAWADSWQLRRR